MTIPEEFQARRKAHDAKIAQLKAEAIKRIKATMVDLGITIADLEERPPRTKSPVLYRDAAGNTWTGVGKRPNWLRDALRDGRTLDEFAVKRK